MELRAAMGLPYRFGGLEVPPPSIGTLCLLEVAGCRAFIDCDPDDFPGVMRMLYICCKRETCAEEVFNYRQRHELDQAKPFDFNDSSTWEPFDRAAFDFALPHLGEADNYIPRLCGLFGFFRAAFNGLDMIPKQSGKKYPWLFDAWTLARNLHALQATSGVTGFDAMWRYPLALATMMNAAQREASGEKNIERPPDIVFLKNIYYFTIKRELAGELHPWQIFNPRDFDLSECQARSEELVMRFHELKSKAMEMTEDEFKTWKDEHHHLIKAEIAACTTAVPICDMTPEQLAEELNHGKA